MDEWNSGMMGKKNKILKPIIPLFHPSIIPALIKRSAPGGSRDGC
jgi:hypothetical protein